jgi:hypothetical protein
MKTHSKIILLFYTHYKNITITITTIITIIINEQKEKYSKG